MDVLKVVDTTERDKIEAWTLANTFPDIIKFIEDAKGDWIVGPEVLIDPSYEKNSDLSGLKDETLKQYLTSKVTVVSHDPKISQSVPKEVIAGGK